MSGLIDRFLPGRKPKGISEADQAFMLSVLTPENGVFPFENNSELPNEEALRALGMFFSLLNVNTTPNKGGAKVIREMLADRVLKISLTQSIEGPNGESPIAFGIHLVDEGAYARVLLNSAFFRNPDEVVGVLKSFRAYEFLRQTAQAVNLYKDNGVPFLGISERRLREDFTQQGFQGSGPAAVFY